MGDPRKPRKKFKTPSHPWQGARIEEEKELSREYGLKNKEEIWKMLSILRDFSDRAKRLVTAKGKQADIEKEQMMVKLQSIGLLSQSADLDEVMGLGLRDILDRRLQTQVQKKNLARSTKQARQFITHGHIAIGNKTITTPSYIVTVEDEPLINFSSGSNLADVEHPERFVEKKEEPVKRKKEEKDEDKKDTKDKKEKSAKKVKKEKAEEKEKQTKEEKPAEKKEVKKETEEQKEKAEEGEKNE